MCKYLLFLVCTTHTVFVVFDAIVDSKTLNVDLISRVHECVRGVHGCIGSNSGISIGFDIRSCVVGELNLTLP